MAKKESVRIYAVFRGEKLSQEVLKLFELDGAIRPAVLEVEVRPEVWPCRNDFLVKLFPLSGPVDVNINEYPYEPEIKIEIVTDEGN